MKAFALIAGALAYLALGIVQWCAEVDGFREVLHWPLFFCWVVSTFTAWIPVVGTAAGVWGAHAAWGWQWLPSLSLFLGIPLLFIVLVAALTGIAAFLARRVRA